MRNRRYGALALGLSLLGLFVLLLEPGARSLLWRTLALPWLFSLASWLSPRPLKRLPLALVLLVWAAESLRWLLTGQAEVVNGFCAFIGYVSLELWERSDAIPLPGKQRREGP